MVATGTLAEAASSPVEEAVGIQKEDSFEVDLRNLVEAAVEE